MKKIMEEAKRKNERLVNSIRGISVFLKKIVKRIDESVEVVECIEGIEVVEGIEGIEVRKKEEDSSSEEEEEDSSSEEEVETKKERRKRKKKEKRKRRKKKKAKKKAKKAKKRKERTCKYPECNQTMKGHPRDPNNPRKLFHATNPQQQPQQPQQHEEVEVEVNVFPSPLTEEVENGIIITPGPGPNTTDVNHPLPPTYIGPSDTIFDVNTDDEIIGKKRKRSKYNDDDENEDSETEGKKRKID